MVAEIKAGTGTQDFEAVPSWGVDSLFFCFSLHPPIPLLLNLLALWVQRDAHLVCIYPSLMMLLWVHYERYCLSLGEKQESEPLGTNITVICMLQNEQGWKV